MPGQIAGRRSDALVSLIDIMPTCFAAVGIAPPKNDGRDLTQSLEDGGHPYVFSESRDFRAVTDARHKYIHVLRGDNAQMELYDLQSDPNEYHNQILNPDYAETLAALRGAMVDQFMKDLLR